MISLGSRRSTAGMVGLTADSDALSTTGSGWGHPICIHRDPRGFKGVGMAIHSEVWIFWLLQRCVGGYKGMLHFAAVANLSGARATLAMYM